MGTESLPWVMRPGRGADHPLPSKRRGHEIIELYLYSPSGPSWPVTGKTLPLPLQYKIQPCRHKKKITRVKNFPPTETEQDIYS